MDQKPEITIDDFAKIDLRVGVIEKAEVHPNGDKLVVLTVDFGSLGKRTICAGIREYVGNDIVELGRLHGKRAVFVVNLPPRTMRGVVSQGMILAASSDDRSRLAIVQTPDAIIKGDPSGLVSLYGGELVG